MGLVAIPCLHYWLEMKTSGGKVTALCKFYKCRKRVVFTLEQWEELAKEGRALNKPVRI